MEKSVAYIKNVALAIVGFLVLFVAVGAITVVLNGATWDQLGDWSLKAVLVAAILFVLNVAGSLIVGLLTKDK
jgi:hypothetical protein